MSATLPKPQRLTPEEYLAIERAAETKSEFLDGEMFEMSRASLAHVQIVGNVAGELGNQLKGSPCMALSSALRLRTPTALYTYPDVVVVCKPVQLADDHNDMLLNPTILIEVMSDSTRSYDRGDKFAHYRSLPSLREYLLIDQYRVHAEHYVRRSDPDGWFLTETDRIADTLKLQSVGVELKLVEVYDGVELQGA